MQEDAYLIRALDQAGMNFIVSNSFPRFSRYMVNVLADFPLSVTTKKQLSAFWASSRLPFAVFTLAPTTGALLVEKCAQ